MLDIPNCHTAVQTSCRNRTQGRYMYSFYSLQINSSQFNGAKIIKIVAHRQLFSICLKTLSYNMEWYIFAEFLGNSQDVTVPIHLICEDT